MFPLTWSLHSVHCSLLPEHRKSVEVYFTLKHSFTDLRYAIAGSVFTQTKFTREVWQCISVNKYNHISAHFNALWIEHIHSLWTRIMVEYLVKSISPGTYDGIQQMSEVIRGRPTYKMCAEWCVVRTGIENHCGFQPESWGLNKLPRGPQDGTKLFKWMHYYTSRAID